jgi:rubrerythrin
MRCWNCGKNISKHIPFCPHCGVMQDAVNEKTFAGKDPFEILQISKDAEDEVIKAAYRSLAKKYHPDSNPSPEAEDKMKEITWAFELLSDPDKRREWRMRKDQQEQDSRTQFSQPKSNEESPSPFTTCPVCGERINDRLGPCPICKAKEAERKATFWKYASIVIGLLIIGVGVIYFSMVGNAGENISKSEPTQKNNQFATRTAAAEARMTRLANISTTYEPTISQADVILTQGALQFPTGNCIKYVEVNDTHVGKEICVYGQIVEIRENTTSDGYIEYVIRFSIPDKFLFKSIRIYFPELRAGECVSIVGSVKTNNQYFYMQAQGLDEVEIYTRSSCD